MRVKPIIESRASATISGVRTNRVRVKRATEASPQRALRRYRKDPLVHGMTTVLVCISVPAQELASMDALCESVQMARSHLIRQAVKLFAEHVRRKR